MTSTSLCSAYAIHQAHPWLSFSDCKRLCAWEEAWLMDQEIDRYWEEHGDDPGWKWRGRVGMPKVMETMKSWAKEPREKVKERFDKAKAEALELHGSHFF